MHETMLAEMADLRADGWTVLPWDEPETAQWGYVATKEGEQDRMARWPMFEGGPYGTDKALVDGVGLLDFAKGPGVLRCDDPMRRLLGFISYDHGRRMAVVRHTTLTGFKDTPPDVREALQVLRATLSDAHEAHLSLLGRRQASSTR